MTIEAIEPIWWIVTFLLGVGGFLGIYASFVSKKGSLSIGLGLMIIGFLGIAAAVVDNDTTGGLDKDPDTWYDAASGYSASFSVSSPTVGTLVDTNPSAPYIKLLSTDLNSANLTVQGYTITTSRTDSVKDVNQAYPILEYQFTGTRKKSVDDSGDSTLYSTIFYNETERYDMSFDTIRYDVRSGKATDALSQATAATGVYASNHEDYTTLDKLVASDHEYVIVSKTCMFLEGVSQGCLEERYYQT